MRLTSRCTRPLTAGKLCDRIFSRRKMKKYQFVRWFPSYKGFGYKKAIGALALIFDWYIWLGFWEIRKWHHLKNGEAEVYNAVQGNEQ